ncbi:MAG: response regulator transcription factor [Alistipes finegoldii]
MNIVSTLNEKLLRQNFDDEHSEALLWEECRQTALAYVRTENALAVLSDLQSNTSRIYNGRTAVRLGLAEHTTEETIASIWEEKSSTEYIPTTCWKTHAGTPLFGFLQEIPIAERVNYYVSGQIRMRDATDIYVPIRHRMFYIGSTPNGSLRMALCLYDSVCTVQPDYTFVNSATGEIISPETRRSDNLLSDREKEVLQLISAGKMSKEIAILLSISIHTVNRHRQNILSKLKADTSIEACRIAEYMHLIS